MSYRRTDFRDEKTRKNDPRLAGAIFGAVMLISVLGAWLLPVLFVAVVVYIAYKSKMRQEKDGQPQTGGTLMEKFSEFAKKMDEADESGGSFNVFSSNDARAHQRRGEQTRKKLSSAKSGMDARFNDARRRQSSDGETLYSMLSRSERQHVDSLTSDFHDEYLHRSNELKDLLNAGIIERDEYSERMAMLKEEFKK